MKTEKLIYVDSNKERNTSTFAITIVHMFSYLLHNSTRCITRNMKPFAALLLNCGAFGADLCVCLCAVFLGLNVAKEWVYNRESVCGFSFFMQIMHNSIASYAPCFCYLYACLCMCLWIYFSCVSFFWAYFFCLLGWDHFFAVPLLWSRAGQQQQQQQRIICVTWKPTLL